MPFELIHRYFPTMCRERPDALFVFGDNLAGYGKAGQACIRDEPNAVGLPTKRTPSTLKSAYFSDADLREVIRASHLPIQRLLNHVSAGKTVIWPQDDIGTGSAKLEQNAPLIALHYQVMKQLLITAAEEFNEVSTNG